MAGKKTQTPRSKIRSALRKLWLQSRERRAALKREGYCCERCKVKQSRAKGREVYIECHHKAGIDWEGVIDIIIERILQTPEAHEVLCQACHGDEHKNGEAQ